MSMLLHILDHLRRFAFHSCVLNFQGCEPKTSGNSTTSTDNRSDHKDSNASKSKTNNNRLAAKTCASTEFQCLNKNYCVHHSWVCDGDPDCPDGSDEAEEQCGTKVSCRSDQFACENGECIPGHLQCSGAEECSDGSDERNCRE